MIQIAYQVYLDDEYRVLNAYIVISNEKSIFITVTFYFVPKVIPLYTFCEQNVKNIYT